MLLRIILPLTSALILILALMIAALIGVGAGFPMDAATISAAHDQGRQQTYFLIDLNVRAVVRSPVTIRSGYLSFVSPGGRHLISTQPLAESVTTVEDVWLHDLISGRSSIVGRVHAPLLSEPLWSSDGRYALLRGLPAGAAVGDVPGTLVIDAWAARSRFLVLEAGAVTQWGGSRRVLAMESGGITIIDLPDEAPRRLPIAPPDAGNRVAAASPDGSLLAVGRYDEANGLDLEIVDAASGAVRLRFDGPERDYGPDWSPDGRWLAFKRFDAENTAGVITIDLQSGQEYRIALPDWITDPAFVVTWIDSDRLWVHAIRPDGAARYLLIACADGSRPQEWALPVASGFQMADERLIYYDSAYGTLHSVAFDGDQAATTTLHTGPARPTITTWLDDGRMLFYDVQIGSGSSHRLRLARPGGGIVTVFTPPEIGIGAMVYWR
jgi:hypothetical protein